MQTADLQVTGPEHASGMQKSHLKVEVQGWRSRAGTRKMVRKEVGASRSRKSKSPTLRPGRGVSHLELARPFRLCHTPVGGAGVSDDTIAFHFPEHGENCAPKSLNSMMDYLTLESSCGAGGPGSAGQGASHRTEDRSSEIASTPRAPGKQFPAN